MALSCKVVLTSLGLNLNMELNCVCLRSKSYYAFTKKHGSAMHVAFLDASKAFDRVNRRKLLLIGLYREYAIAIQDEVGDSNGGKL